MANDLILIVDNDPDLRSVLAEALVDYGFRVAMAPNGMQALLTIAREQPRIVLLDMQMPVLDGAGFAERLAEFGRHAAIIVVSGFAVSQAELRKVGALAFIAKPFELSHLVHEIYRLLREPLAA